MNKKNEFKTFSAVAFDDTTYNFLVTPEGEIYCYDFTLNIALKKDDYYRLFHTKVFEKISHQQLMDDRELFLKLLAKNSIYSKLYLSSREEALNIAKTL